MTKSRLPTDLFAATKQRTALSCRRPETQLEATRSSSPSLQRRRRDCFSRRPIPVDITGLEKQWTARICSFQVRRSSEPQRISTTLLIEAPLLVTKHSKMFAISLQRLRIQEQRRSIKVPSVSKLRVLELLSRPRLERQPHLRGN